MALAYCCAFNTNKNTIALCSTYYLGFGSKKIRGFYPGFFLNYPKTIHKKDNNSILWMNSLGWVFTSA
jgi:hypothetical protein